jgi:hypothetical protein
MMNVHPAMASWLLAQAESARRSAPGDQLPAERVVPWIPMLVGGVLLAGLIIAVLSWLKRNRDLREHRAYLADRLGLEEIDLHDGQFRLVYDRLHELALCVATFDLNIQYAAVGRIKDWTIELIDVGNMWAALTNVGQTIVLLRDDSLDLPAFVMVPSNKLLRRMAGEKFEQFPHDTIFSSNNRLHIGYRNAHHLFSEDIRYALRTNEKLTIEGLGDHLAFYQFGYRTAPDDLEPFIEQCVRLADMFRDSARRAS